MRNEVDATQVAGAAATRQENLINPRRGPHRGLGGGVVLVHEPLGAPREGAELPETAVGRARVVEVDALAVAAPRELAGEVIAGRCRAGDRLQVGKRGPRREHVGAVTGNGSDLQVVGVELLRRGGIDGA